MLTLYMFVLFLQLLKITNHLLWNASSYYGNKFGLKTARMEYYIAP